MRLSPGREWLLAEALPNAGKGTEPIFDQPVDALRRIKPLRRPVRRPDDRSDSATPSSIVVTGKMKNLPAPHASITSAAKHQMLHVGVRDQYALGSGEAALLADVEEAFDFLVYAANGLDLALLIHRAGHREILAQRKLSKRRQERIELGRGGAIAFNAAVGLLEDQSSRTATSAYPARTGRPESPTGSARPWSGSDRRARPRARCRRACRCPAGPGR